MYTILFCIVRNELRVVDAVEILVNANGVCEVPHWTGPPIRMLTPPIAGTLTRMDGLRVGKGALPMFENVDDAWASVRDDYCPSLHP